TAEKDRKVTPFYDPMIAKLIVTKDTREEEIHTMINTLEEYTIEGIKTNIPMILTVIQSDMFQSGITTTDFVQTYYTKYEVIIMDEVKASMDGSVWKILVKEDETVEAD